MIIWRRECQSNSLTITKLLQVRRRPGLNATEAATPGLTNQVFLPWEIQLGVIGVAAQQNVMDYVAEWEYEEEEDELGYWESWIGEVGVEAFQSWIWVDRA